MTLGVPHNAHTICSIVHLKSLESSRPIYTTTITNIRTHAVLPFYDPQPNRMRNRVGLYLYLKHPTLALAKNIYWPNMTYYPSVGLMLVHRLRRWTNNKPTLGQLCSVCWLELCGYILGSITGQAKIKIRPNGL